MIRVTYSKKFWFKDKDLRTVSFKNDDEYMKWLLKTGVHVFITKIEK